MVSLQHLLTLSPLEITENALKLVKAYPEDLESLRKECILFTQLWNTVELVKIGSKPQAIALYRLMFNNSLEGCFPNIEIAPQIYLSLMVTNCSTEQLFSKLKRLIMYQGLQEDKQN